MKDYEEMSHEELKYELKLQTDNMSYAEKNFYKAKSKCIEIEYLIKELENKPKPEKRMSGFEKRLEEASKNRGK